MLTLLMTWLLLSSPTIPRNPLADDRVHCSRARWEAQIIRDNGDASGLIVGAGQAQLCFRIKRDNSWARPQVVFLSSDDGPPQNAQWALGWELTKYQGSRHEHDVIYNYYDESDDYNEKGMTGATQAIEVIVPYVGVMRANFIMRSLGQRIITVVSVPNMEQQEPPFEKGKEPVPMPTLPGGAP